MKPALIIIGLGNPGEDYAATRHNTGFRALDALAKIFKTGEWRDQRKFLADTMEGRIVTVPVLLVKPRTYMNRSGECVRKLLDFYHLEPAQALILCDDIDLAPGDLRFREKGGPGTHNGLKSIVEQIGEEFPRIRIGIGPQKEGEDLSVYVLSKPSDTERKEIAAAMTKIPEIVRGFVLGEKGGASA